MMIRKLELKDASLMLEWMHDENVVKDLSTNFAGKSISDCEDFIRSSKDTSNNIHMAIASESDEYMGTVSLKNIDRDSQSVEFAITVRKSAMGSGYAWFGMTEIIRMAFEDIGLNCVYWCVSKKNTRAIAFYEKNGFKEAFEIPNNILSRYTNDTDLKWYSVLAGDDYRNGAIRRAEIASCKVIRIKTVPTVDAGELSFFEANGDIPFSIKRIYYISKVPQGIRRGSHAHKELKQLIFCPYGKVQLTLDDGENKEDIVLYDPSIGILIDKPIWREILWLQKDSVLCVAASDYYKTSDYIRDYEEFKDFIKKEGAR
ncbi:MAG: GNAT family N-acetyltransferase [Mobilitalea sp.]